MTLKAFKYLSPLIIYVGLFMAFMVTGWKRNMSATGEELAKAYKTYEMFLYAVVILKK